MPQTRPFECPACGYERLQRTANAARGRGERRDSVERWSCRLCEYEWTVAVQAPGRRDDWALV